MERREASRAKRAHLLSPKEIGEIIMASDNEEGQCVAYSKEDEEVERSSPSPACASSQTPPRPDFPANISEYEDAVQHVAG